MRNLAENIIETAWHDTSQLLITDHSGHGMSLSCAGLTVGENGTVVAFEHVCDNGCGCLSVDVALQCIVSVRHIKGELLWLFPSERLLHHDLTSLVVDIDDLGVALRQLFVVHGSAPDGDFDRLVLLRQDDLLILIFLSTPLDHRVSSNATVIKP